MAADGTFIQSHVTPRMITVSTFENGETGLATQDRLHAHGTFQIFVRLLAQVVIRICQVNRTKIWGVVDDKFNSLVLAAAPRHISLWTVFFYRWIFKVAMKREVISLYDKTGEDIKALCVRQRSGVSPPPGGGWWQPSPCSIGLPCGKPRGSLGVASG